MTAPALIYVRLSEDKLGDELGITRQKQDCQKLVEARGWDVVRVESDNDTSAKGTKPRPGFERVLSAVERGEVSVIVAWNLDRLTRNRRDTLRLMELGQEKGITIALARGSDMDLSTPAGRMLAGILAEIARAEIDTKSDRQIRANKQRAEAGLPHFVSRPYGYTRQGEIIEDEALVLNQMASHFLSGWSTSEITRWLNDQHIPAASGGEWSRRVVKDHLLSKRNAGIRVYKGFEYPAKWTPIYTAELHERLCAEWKRRHGEGKRARPDNRKYLLTGLLRCGICGRPMMGGAHYDRKGEESRAKYRCVASGSGCTGMMRVAVTLDHLITESVLYRLDSDELRTLLMQQESRADEIAPLRDKEAVLRARLDSLLTDYADGLLDRTEYATAKARVQETLSGVESELAAIYSSEQANALLSPSVSLRDAWESNPVSWRRKLLALVIDSVVVEKSYKRTPYVVGGKTYKMDADAVKINWKV